MDMKDQGEISVLQVADQEVITIKTDENKYMLYILQKWSMA
jgi:hypothetical protein